MQITEDFDIQEILREIREDVTRRAADKSRVYGGRARNSSTTPPMYGFESGQGARSVLPITPRSVPILTHLEQSSSLRSAASARDISLPSLLKLEDAEFVEAAYLRILHRLPDEDGRNNYLGLLRGGMPKIEMLSALWHSSEGRALGASVPGLRPRLYWHRLVSAPILSLILTPLNDFILSASNRKQQRVAIGKLFLDMEVIRRESKRAFSLIDGSFGEFTNCLSDLISYSSASRQEIAELRGLLDRANDMVAVLQTGIEGSVTRGELASKLDDFQAFRESVSRRLDLLNAKLLEEAALFTAKHQELSSAVVEVRDQVGTRLELLGCEKLAKVEFEAQMLDLRSKMKEAVQPLRAQSLDLRRTVLDQDRRLEIFLEEARRRIPAPFSPEQVERLVKVGSHRLDAMYATFEDRFRGTRADIRNRQSIYVPIIREACAGMVGAAVLDLGCGRGEWLEKLRDEGIGARGIDINQIFLEGCRKIDLEVAEADVVEHLRSLKTGSLGAVTCFHLIEHLPLDNVIAMLDETLRVLRPGGVAIFETPNPENVFVGSCSFYFDPTHRKPLPPGMAKYLFEARGFCHIDLLYLHPHDPSAHIVGSDRVVSDFINKHFFGPQDYAVIGKKVMDA